MKEKFEVLENFAFNSSCSITKLQYLIHNSIPNLSNIFEHWKQMRQNTIKQGLKSKFEKSSQKDGSLRNMELKGGKRVVAIVPPCANV